MTRPVDREQLDELERQAREPEPPTPEIPVPEPAVLALQRANGINDSGLLGPKTWNAAWQGRPPTG